MKLFKNIIRMFWRVLIPEKSRVAPLRKKNTTVLSQKESILIRGVHDLDCGGTKFLAADDILVRTIAQKAVISRQELAK